MFYPDDDKLDGDEKLSRKERKKLAARVSRFDSMQISLTAYYRRRSSSSRLPKRRPRVNSQSHKCEA